MKSDTQLELERVIFEALGYISVASWSEEPKGIFQDQTVVKIGNKLVEDILNITAQHITLPQSIHLLQAELLNDEDYRRSWTANIAMAFKDNYHRNKLKYKNRGDIHIIANNAAEEFITQLCKS